MTIHLGDVPASSVLYIPFASYNSSGASVTLTGLAASDIEIYKNGSTTQRSSDAGYTLLDTDGIDFDGITGLHGFSIDLSDNTDAGFYSVGGFYWVVVSTVTIDSQTVTLIAATFRIVAAEAVAGKPKVDVDAWLGTAAATPTTAGVPEVDITHIAGAAVSASSAQLGVNVVNAAGTAWNSGSIGAATLATDTITADKIAAAAITSSELADGAITSAKFAAGAITAAAIATDAIDADALAADAVAEIADGVWDEDATGHQTQGTFGQAIGDPAADANTIYAAVVTGAAGATIAADIIAVKAETASILTDTAEIGAAGAGLTEAGGTGDHLTAIPWNAAWDAEVQSECTDALNAYDPPTNAELATEINLVLTDIAALNNISVADVLTTQMTESYAANGTAPTLAQAMFAVQQYLMDFAITGTSYSVKQLDGSEAFVVTLDSSTSPTAAARN